jgi:hypothetical protein
MQDRKGHELLDRGEIGLHRRLPVVIEQPKRHRRLPGHLDRLRIEIERLPPALDVRAALPTAHPLQHVEGPGHPVPHPFLLLLGRIHGEVIVGPRERMIADAGAAAFGYAREAGHGMVFGLDHDGLRSPPGVNCTFIS